MNETSEPCEAAAQPTSGVAGRMGRDSTTCRTPCGGEILGASVPAPAVVEGAWKLTLVVVQRGPSTVRGHACVASGASQPLHTRRRQAALVLVEGWR
jgi:hypothetical protein